MKSFSKKAEILHKNVKLWMICFCFTCFFMKKREINFRFKKTFSQI